MVDHMPVSDLTIGGLLPAEINGVPIYAAHNLPGRLKDRPARFVVVRKGDYTTAAYGGGTNFSPGLRISGYVYDAEDSCEELVSSDQYPLPEHREEILNRSGTMGAYVPHLPDDPTALLVQVERVAARVKGYQLEGRGQ